MTEQCSNCVRFTELLYISKGVVENHPQHDLRVRGECSRACYRIVSSSYKCDKWVERK